jgi:hypothetical protein
VGADRGDDASTKVFDIHAKGCRRSLESAGSVELLSTLDESAKSIALELRVSNVDHKCR